MNSSNLIIATNRRTSTLPWIISGTTLAVLALNFLQNDVLYSLNVNISIFRRHVNAALPQRSQQGCANKEAEHNGVLLTLLTSLGEDVQNWTEQNNELHIVLIQTQ